ncbi:MAG: hypothetical protein AAFY08_14070 [Planctomycetota bacterium]
MPDEHDNPTIAPRDERVVRELAELRGSVKSVADLVRHSVTEQKTTNTVLLQRLERVESKVEAIDKWRAVKDATIPDKLISEEEIDQRFDGLNERLGAVQLQLARYIGLGVGAMIVIQLALTLWKMVGGAS